MLNYQRVSHAIWYLSIWLWIHTYENTIFRGMNIHKSQRFWCELQGYKVLTHCHISLGLGLKADQLEKWDGKSRIGVSNWWLTFSFKIGDASRGASSWPRNVRVFWGVRSLDFLRWWRFFRGSKSAKKGNRILCLMAKLGVVKWLSLVVIVLALKRGIGKPSGHGYFHPLISCHFDAEWWGYSSWTSLISKFIVCRYLRLAMLFHFAIDTVSNIGTTLTIFYVKESQSQIQMSHEPT